MSIFTLAQPTTVRKGKLTLPHGELVTPFFMPDATRATVRGLLPVQLQALGLEALVVNTYHLMLQPGSARILAAGGVHRFMQWPGPILSDSGGYQVFSLIHRKAELGKISEAGVEFRSVLDGSKHLLTPERSIQIQFDLGVDMLVVLDDPRPNDVSEEEMRASVERTLRWAERCRVEYDRQVTLRSLTEETRPAIFGVVQGGKLPELRQYCAEQLSHYAFDGYGFGGRHVDEQGNFLAPLLEATAAAIPQDKIRFALGIGTPQDIAHCYHLGWDMFDCVIPTREGRHGRLFIWNESAELWFMQDGSRRQSVIQSPQANTFYRTINIRNECYKEDDTRVDPTCDCDLCSNFTSSYLHHLFRVDEPLALVLASAHNLRFYLRLMEHLRAL